MKSKIKPNAKKKWNCSTEREYFHCMITTYLAKILRAREIINAHTKFTRWLLAVFLHLHLNEAQKFLRNFRVEMYKGKKECASVSDLGILDVCVWETVSMRLKNKIIRSLIMRSAIKLCVFAHPQWQRQLTH